MKIESKILQADDTDQTVNSQKYKFNDSTLSETGEKDQNVTFPGNINLEQITNSATKLPNSSQTQKSHESNISEIGSGDQTVTINVKINLEQNTSYEIKSTNPFTSPSNTNELNESTLSKTVGDQTGISHTKQFNESPLSETDAADQIVKTQTNKLNESTLSETDAANQTVKSQVNQNVKQNSESVTKLTNSFASTLNVIPFMKRYTNQIGQIYPKRVPKIRLKSYMYTNKLYESPLTETDAADQAVTSQIYKLNESNLWTTDVSDQTVFSQTNKFNESNISLTDVKDPTVSTQKNELYHSINLGNWCQESDCNITSKDKSQTDYEYLDKINKNGLKESTLSKTDVKDATGTLETYKYNDSNISETASGQTDTSNVQINHTYNTNYETKSKNSLRKRRDTNKFNDSNISETVGGQTEISQAYLIDNNKGRSKYDTNKEKLLQALELHLAMTRLSERAIEILKNKIIQLNSMYAKNIGVGIQNNSNSTTT
ncbi:hypothetical protein RF11_11813 [Thelohanellus kitauei]|uniref:Uncharacterized protein n=1 Tax=Thelohanellus kitauei TaxID=669202 RepID=A0A0C2J6N8_THEKT|nr:hypothetical protein RF11_11813 [Thelohanellus kitauei]